MINVKEVEAMLVRLGVYNTHVDEDGEEVQVADSALAQSICRVAASQGHASVSEKFVREYLKDGGTDVDAVPKSDPDADLDEDADEDEDEDADEDEDK